MDANNTHHPANSAEEPPWLGVASVVFVLRKLFKLFKWIMLLAMVKMMVVVMVLVW